jgi:hypothetical protein
VHRIILKDNPSIQLGSYKWSSYPAYIKAETEKNILANIDCDEVLGLLSADGEKRRFIPGVCGKRGQADLEAFENRMYRASVVGSEDFVEKIKEISRSSRKRPRSSRREIRSSLYPGARKIGWFMPWLFSFFYLSQQAGFLSRATWA